MRQLDWVSSSTEILHYLSGQRVDHTPVVTSEAFQLYLLPRLNFNLILQWVEAQESYQHIAGIFLVSHAMLQCVAFCAFVAFFNYSLIILHLQDEDLLFHVTYHGMRHQSPALMLPSYVPTGFLGILQCQAGTKHT